MGHKKRCKCFFFHRAGEEGGVTLMYAVIIDMVPVLFTA